MQKLHGFKKKRARPTKKCHLLNKDTSRYGSSLAKSFIVDRHIIGFKTHDFHNFMKVLYIII